MFETIIFIKIKKWIKLKTDENEVKYVKGIKL